MYACNYQKCSQEETKAYAVLGATLPSLCVVMAGGLRVLL